MGGALSKFGWYVGIHIELCIAGTGLFGSQDGPCMVEAGIPGNQIILGVGGAGLLTKRGGVGARVKGGLGRYAVLGTAGLLALSVGTGITF